MRSTAGRLGLTVNVVHGAIYFTPEATIEYDAVGLPADHHYFASRAAPLGPVGPELVVATFFNFNPDLVRSVIPAAWTHATPESIQHARMRAGGRVLADACGSIDAAELREALEIARAMVDGVGDEGKPLAAANRAVAIPDDPHIELFQLLATIREWRGDAHVAVLTSTPVGALEALVLHVATGIVSEQVMRATRAWPDADWIATRDALAERGLVNSDGSFTDAGREFRQDIEDATDRAAQPLVDAVGDETANRLCDLLRPIRTALIDSGVYPARP